MGEVLGSRLPHATDEQAARAIRHVRIVAAAAHRGNQHNKNMVVLMDQATAMNRRIEDLEGALQWIRQAASASGAPIDTEATNYYWNNCQDIAAFIDKILPPAEQSA